MNDRDEFAKAAMTGLLNAEGAIDPRELADTAYEYADAMLARSSTDSAALAAVLVMCDAVHPDFGTRCLRVRHRYPEPHVGNGQTWST